MAKSLSAIQAEIIKLNVEMNELAKSMQPLKSEYTPQGLQKRYADTVKRAQFGERIAKLREQAAAWNGGAHKSADDAVNKLLPYPAEPNARVATELAMQRVLSRPNLDADTAREIFEKLGTSCERTMLGHEFAARGLVSQEMQDGILKANEPEYAAAQDSRNYADTATHVLGSQLDFLERLAGDFNASSDATEQINVSDIPGADVAY